jgi:predicted transcriptional regulator
MPTITPRSTNCDVCRFGVFYTHLSQPEAAMSVRLNIVLSDALSREIEKAAEETETSKSEVFRKALQLYLAARAGKERGLKLGLVEQKTDKLQTEIIGL